ncbi:hypothetical protein [Pseudaminobacter sp. NGMCC 1.201702]|uniref:hypothetical protein n=1 Tax=Pseudaminobacter sp. NGMCC 1.201702 TaxID=3391825 RepID=UPI0039F14B79
MAHVAASIAKGTHDPVEYTTVIKPVRDPSQRISGSPRAKILLVGPMVEIPDAGMDAMLSNPS